MLGSFSAIYLQALTKSGGIASFVIGCFVGLGFGFKGLLVLGGFFITASLLSAYKISEKQGVIELLAKGAKRDHIQVIANGGVAALLGISYYFYATEVILISFLIVIASNTADTWASEIGVLSKQKPFSIKSFSRVPQGTSGAVSLLGTIAALFGALFITTISSFFFKEITLKLFILIVICGFLGNIFDTILGAFFQVKFKCQSCGLITERLTHCGKLTEHSYGLQIINNDFVNLLSGLLAAVLGAVLYIYI